MWGREGRCCVNETRSEAESCWLGHREAAAAVGLGLMCTEPLGKSVLRSIVGQIHSLQLVLKGEELTGACLAQLFKQQDNVWL